MTTILDALWLAALFLAGLIVRVALVALVVAVLGIPILLALEAWRRAPMLYRRLRGVRSVGGLDYRDGVAYAPGHVWLEPLAKGKWRVGLDGVAQRLLAPVSEVLLPEAGREVETGEGAIRIRSGEVEVSLPLPVRGRITAVNPALAADPLRAGRDPYLGGWLLELAPGNGGLRALPRGRSARDWFRGEAARLNHLIEGRYGFAAADGGELVPAAGSLEHDASWAGLVARFLRPVSANGRVEPLK